MEAHYTYTVAANNTPFTRKGIKDVAAALIGSARSMSEYQAVKDRSYELQRSFSQPGALVTQASPSDTLNKVRMSLDTMIGMASQLHGSVAPLHLEAAALPMRGRTSVSDAPAYSAHGGSSGRSSRRPSMVESAGVELQESTTGEPRN